MNPPAAGPGDRRDDRRVEARVDELRASLLRRGDVEDDVGKPTGKWHQLGCEHHRGGEGGHQQPDASRRPLAQTDDLIEDCLTALKAV